MSKSVSVRLAWFSLLIATVGGFACSERGLDVQVAVTGDGGAGNGGDGGNLDAQVKLDARLPGPDATPKADMGPPCIPTGMPENCNNLDDDCNGKVDDVDPGTVTSPDQCGGCNIVCAIPANAKATCVNAACGYECEPGTIDVDGSKNNGCECILLGATLDAEKNKPEMACDGRDNDCDGMTDEGFDKNTDVNHCGACNYRCSFSFANTTCVDGKCKMGACLTGYFDRDGNPANGCEVACTLSNGGKEICDGVDNDCNGMVDDGVTATTQCRGMGVCAGIQPVCMGVKGWICNYPATYQAAEDKTAGCDGLDNDCDGSIDEPFGVGGPCTVGQGGCQNTGMYVCSDNKMDVKCSVAPKPMGAELCNGVDDDCDGMTDEIGAGGTTDDRFVYVSGLGLAQPVTMFAYEASRYDATNASVGADSSRRPCSVGGRLPWANVTATEAEESCRLLGAGWRLCTKTEWEAACKGQGATVFPYGPTYAANTCNGADFPRQANQTTVPAGSAAMCISSLAAGAADDLLDMSGNVKEWVVSGAPNNSPAAQTYELRGGAYNTASFNGDAPGLKCDSSVPAPSVPVRLPSVGFRCCKPGML